MRIAIRKFYSPLFFVVAMLQFASLTNAQDKIPGIGPVGEIKKLHTDFGFTEGPVAVGADLYFSDIPNNRVHKVDAEGKLTTFREKSNKTNGLIHRGGEIFGCQGDAGQIVAWTLDGKNERVIADKYEDKRFNSPNDLVIDKTGGIYFTDPNFGAPKPNPQDKTAVYYVDSNKKVTRLVPDLPNPNGVLLSPDEKLLYVVPSGQSKVMVYDITSPGMISNGRVFCELKQPEKKKNTGGDGLTVDTKGNLYITSQLHIQVFSPQGEALGIIKFPEQPANVTFGGKDGKTLFATARKSLYSVEMEATGHQFGTK